MRMNSDIPSFSNFNTQQRYQDYSNNKKQIIYERIEARRMKNQNAQRTTPTNKFRKHESPLTQPNKAQVGQASSEEQYFRSKRRDKSHNKTQSGELRGQPNQRQGLKLERGDEEREMINKEGEKLNEKLVMIEEKMGKMKQNLQKKKQQKLKQIQLKKKMQQTKNHEQQHHGKNSSLKNFVTQVPQHKQLHHFQTNPYSPNHNIYYVSEVVRAFKDEKSVAREHLQTTLQIMAYFERVQKPSDEVFSKEKLRLQKRKGYEDKKTVIFDLDETLIHCNESLDDPHDIQLPIVFPTGEIIEAGINIRPYAQEILKNLSEYFQVIIFTASHPCYANVVLDYLDPHNLYIHHRLFRQNCYATPQGMNIKDLRVMDRQMSDMVLVDNAAYSYIHQLDNGIPILPYYHGKDDFELKKLEQYLKSMFLVKDMREVNKKVLKLDQYKKFYYDLEKLVEELYLVDHK